MLHVAIHVRWRTPMLAIGMLVACGPVPGDRPAQSGSGDTGDLATSTGLSSESASETTANTEVDPECPDLVLEGDLAVQSLEDADSLPLYTQVNGYVYVGAEGLVDLEFLRCLRRVQGQLTLSQNADLMTAHGLEKLEHVGSMRVQYNESLESLHALANLHTIDGYALVDGNPSLVSLGLPGLVRVERFEIGYVCGAPHGGNPVLAEIGGLGSLAEFDGLLIMGNPLLERIDGLEGLEGRIGSSPNPELRFVISFVGNESLSFEHVDAVLGEADASGTISLGGHCGNLGDEECGECIPGE